MEATGLTRQDINAIRQADDVILRHIDRTGRLDCSKRVDWKEKEKNPYADDYKYYRIPCESVGSGKGIDSLPYLGRDDFHATAWVHPNYWCGSFRTIAHEILKVGDIISLEWKSGYHDNGYIEHAEADWQDKYDKYHHGYRSGSLHVDSCFLVIERKTKSGYKTLRFEVAVNACAENTARMIDPTPKTYCLVHLDGEQAAA